MAAGHAGVDRLAERMWGDGCGGRAAGRRRIGSEWRRDDDARRSQVETAAEFSAPAEFDPAADAVGGSILQAGGLPAPPAVPGLVAGSGEIVVGPVALARAPAGRGRHRVTARRRFEGDVVA